MGWTCGLLQCLITLNTALKLNYPVNTVKKQTPGFCKILVLQGPLDGNTAWWQSREIQSWVEKILEIEGFDLCDNSCNNLGDVDFAIFFFFWKGCDFKICKCTERWNQMISGNLNCMIPIASCPSLSYFTDNSLLTRNWDKFTRLMDLRKWGKDKKV